MLKRFEDLKREENMEREPLSFVVASDILLQNNFNIQISISDQLN